MTITVVCDLAGRIVTASDPLPGGVQDIVAFRAWALSAAVDRPRTVADKGYQGTRMTTPHKKPCGLDQHDSEIVFNRELSGLRSAVERCIAHLKNWKVLKTGYRGRITELPALVRLVQLERLRNAW